MSSSFSCPLCKSKQVEFHFHQELHDRDFYICADCDLSFISREKLLNLNEEKSRYDLHQNSIRSEGYEKFLRRLINPIISKFSKDKKGLDFGCGPYPMLTEILKEEGFNDLKGYDPIYENDLSVFCLAGLTQRYDFITCCEVIEHIYDIAGELDRLIPLLSDGGWLVVSTGIKNPEADLEKWHYIHDDTHINLLSAKTIDWIGARYTLKVESIENALIIFSKR